MGTDRRQLAYWRKHALFVGLWTLLAVLSAAETYIAQSVYSQPISWGLAFRRAFEEWYSWGAVSIGVLGLARRFPYTKANARRWYLIHLLGSMVGAIAFIALYSWLLSGQRSVQDGSILEFGKVFKKYSLHYFLFGVTLCWMVVLAQHGLHYYARYHERELQASALATELVQARLEVLRMQLNPHFLFNTLHTISALIHDHPEAADRIVARLSELLRRTLDLGETQEVRLKQELDFLEGYLEIERMRFQDRLTVEIAVEPGLNDVLVPSLILQPLVENAIRHGVELREDSGRVKIGARRLNDSVELSVSDNGPGLPDNEPAPRREGVGLSNTRSRLSHLYGANHKFDLIPAPGGGLEVRLLMPYRTEVHPYTPRVMILSPGDADSVAACRREGKDSQ